MITAQQHQKLVALKQAIVDVHDAFPGNRDAALLHGMAQRLLAANKSQMTEEQFEESGGNEKDGG